jgi:hypothetical protein
MGHNFLKNCAGVVDCVGAPALARSLAHKGQESVANRLATR